MAGHAWAHMIHGWFNSIGCGWPAAGIEDSSHHHQSAPPIYAGQASSF